MRELAAFSGLAHGRKDLYCAINRSASVTEALFSKRHVKEYNKAVKHSKSNRSLVMRYGHLERTSLHLRVYADASFASKDGMLSQLGFIALICDGADRCYVLTYARKKARRIVRSIMDVGVYDFAYAFYAAYTLKNDFERVYDQPLPLIMQTDLKQMFDVITRASPTTWKRLMIDVAAARDAYSKHEISNVGLVKSEHYVADGLTNPGLRSALKTMLRTGIDNNRAQNWIIRSNPATNLTMTRGTTPAVTSLSEAPFSKKAASPERKRSDDGKPAVGIYARGSGDRVEDAVAGTFSRESDRVGFRSPNRVSLWQLAWKGL